MGKCGLAPGYSILLLRQFRKAFIGNRNKNINLGINEQAKILKESLEKDYDLTEDQNTAKEVIRRTLLDWKNVINNNPITSTEVKMYVNRLLEPSAINTIIETIFPSELPDVDGKKPAEMKLDGLPVSFLARATYSLINSIYGLARLPLITMKNSFKNHIIASLLVDFERGIPITNDELANESICRLKLALFDTVMDYCDAVTGKKSNKHLYLEDSNHDLIFNKTTYSSFVDIVKSLFENVTDNTLLFWFKDRYNPDSLSGKALAAFNAWTMLNNFDNLLHTIVGDAVSINRNYKDIEFSNSNILKYKINTSNNLIKTWRDSDESDALLELGNITKLLIETTPMVDYRTGRRILDLNISIEALSDAFTKLKESKNERMKELMYNFSKSPILFIDQVLKEALKLSFNRGATRIKNTLESVRKRFFSTDPQDNSLAKILMSDYRYLTKMTNYLNHILTFLNLVLPVSHLQYSYDNKTGTYINKESGSFYADKLKLRLTSGIRNFNKGKTKYLVDSLLQKYTVTPLYTGDPTDFKIEYEIEGKRICILFSNTNVGTYKIRSASVMDPTGRIMTPEENGEYIPKALKMFIKDTLNEDLDLKNELLDIAAESWQLSIHNIPDTKLRALYDLASLGCRVLIAHYFNKNGIDDINKYYGFTEKEATQKSLISPKTGKVAFVLFDNTTDKILEAYALVKSIFNNEDAKSTSRNASGNAISNYGITNMSGAALNLIYDAASEENSATSKTIFSEIPNLLMGVTIKTDVTGLDKVTVKEEKNFNLKEYAYSSIMIDFLHNFVEDGTFYITPTVESDRSTYHLIHIDGNKKYNGVAIKDMDATELLDMHYSKMHDVYTVIKSNIEKDWNLIINYLYNNNELFKNFYKEANNGMLPLPSEGNPIKLDYESIRVFIMPIFLNFTNRIELIKLAASKTNATIIDDLHFVSNKNGISSNLTLNLYFDMFCADDDSRYLEYVHTNIKRFADYCKLYLKIPFRKIINGKLYDVDPDIEKYLNDHYEGTILLYEDEWVDRDTLNLIITNEEGVLNPLLYHFFAVDSIFSTQFMMMIVGNCAVHKNLLDGVDTEGLDPLEVEEAGRALTMYKRMVILASTMHNYTQDLINGVPIDYNVAHFDDITGPTFTYNNGDSRKPLKVHDGAARCPAWVVFWQNGSSGEDTTTFDFKPIGHWTDHLYGTSGLLKLAIFSLTNEYIRNSGSIDLEGSGVDGRNLLQKETSKEWSSILEEGDTLDISKDFMGNPIKMLDINPNGIYFLKKNPNTGAIEHYEILSLDKAPLLDNGYILKIALVNIDGNYIDGDGTRLDLPKIKEETRLIKSNFDLWDAFGGEWSEDKINGKLVPGETSNAAVAYYGNNVGIVRKDHTKYLKYSSLRYLTPNQRALAFATAKALCSFDNNGKLTGGLLSQTLIFLPLKHTDIHYAVNNSASKNMHKNVNSSNDYYTKHDSSNPLRTSSMPTANIGPLIDADHEADNSSLTEMSLVISALIENGLTRDIAKLAYTELGKIVEITLSLLVKAMKEYYGQGNANAVYQIIGSAFLHSIASSSGSKASLIEAIVYKILQQLKDNPNLNSLGIKIPFSDNNIMQSAISEITSNINRSAIKRKYSGIGAILLPSYDLIKVYLADGKDYLRADLTQKNIDLNKKQYDIFAGEPLRPLDIELGYSYYVVYDINPNERTLESIEEIRQKDKKLITLDTIKKYKEARKDLNAYYYPCVTAGRNLQPAMGTFEIEEGRGNRSKYNLYDMDSVEYKINFAQRMPSKKATKEETIKAAKECMEFINTEVIPNIKNRSFLVIDNIQNDPVLSKYASFPSRMNSFKKIVEDIIKFYDINPDGVTPAMIDNIKRYLALLNNEFLHLMEYDFALLENNNIAFINGLLRKIITGSLKIKPAEVIMSKIYKTIFGLKEGMSLGDINYKFFEDQITTNSNTINTGFWDIAFKRGNGKHTYFVYEDNIKTEHLYEKRANVTYDPDSGNMVLVDADENITIFNDCKLFTDGENDYIVIPKDREKAKKVLQDFVDFDRSYIDIDVNLAGGNETEFLKNSEIETLLILSDLDTDINRKFKRLRRQYGDWGTNDKNPEAKWSKKNDNGNPLFSGEFIKRELHKWNEESIKRNAKYKYTSFQKSLDVIAARIPSQAMQSFMAMKVVGFTESEENRAYVSHFLTFLQGSDYDIDKAYLMGSEFDESGHYIGWSPLFDLSSPETLKASETLPMPTGEKVILSNSKKALDITLDINLLISIRNLIANNLKTKSTVIVNVTLDGSYNIEQDSGLNYEDAANHNRVLYIKKLSLLISTINANENNLVTYRANKLNKELELERRKDVGNIINLINKHNNYFSSLKGNKRKMILMTKNSVSSKIYRIANSLINFPQGHTLVDLEQPQNAAQRSPLGRKERTFTTMNPSVKWEMRNQTMVGKSSIGITATGQKVLFALLYYFNEAANSNIYDKHRRALFNHLFQFKMEDNTIEVFKNVIAGINTTHVPLLWIDAIKDNIEKVLAKAKKEGFENNPYLLYMIDTIAMLICLVEDSSIINSLLITAATDNAKELILSKINATPEFLKIYTFAVILGIDFDLIANLMISPTVQGINKLIDANIFTDYYSSSRLSTALNYIRRGASPQIPIYEDRIKTKIDEIANTWKEEFKKFEDGTLSKIEFVGSILSSLYDLHELAYECEENNLIEIRSKEWSSLFLYIQKQQEILDIIENDIDGDSFKQFVQLDELANELKSLGNLLSINQGIRVSLYEKVKFIMDMEEAFKTRINKYLFVDFKRNEYSFKSLLISKNKGKYSNLDIEYIISRAKELDILDNFNAITFLTDDAYRKAAIEMYDLVKGTINIFDVVTEVPHFKSMLDSVAIDLDLSRVISHRVDLTYSIARILLRDHFKGLNKKQKELLLKNLSNYILAKIITKYFKDESISVSVDASVSQINLFSRRGISHPIKGNTTVYLGSEEGLATFKAWMENVVIPNLKLGKISDISPAVNLDLLNNKFIQNLLPNSTDFTFTGHEKIRTTLDINMSERASTADQLMYAEYLNAFNALHSMTYNNIPIINLLFWYNLITYLNLYGEDSLTRLFENKIDFDDENNAIGRYFKFVGHLDKTKTLLISDIPMDELLLNCAVKLNHTLGISSFYRSKYNLIYDTKTLTYKLYEWQYEKLVRLSEEDRALMYEMQEILGEDDDATFVPYEYKPHHFYKLLTPIGSESESDERDRMADIINYFPVFNRDMFKISGKNPFSLSDLVFDSKTLTAQHLIDLFLQGKILIYNNCE